MRIRNFIMILMLLIISCDKNEKGKEDDEPEIELVKPPIDCLGKKRSLDSLGIAVALIGIWEWKYANCGWRDPSDDVFKDVEVTFSDNGVMTITGDGDPRTTSWTLKSRVDENKKVYELDIHPVEVSLMGGIVHCENYVMFSELYIDGCDHIFKKVE